MQRLNGTEYFYGNLYREWSEMRDNSTSLEQHKLIVQREVSKSITQVVLLLTIFLSSVFESYILSNDTSRPTVDTISQDLHEKLLNLK
jgi:hypothetical protein